MPDLPGGDASAADQQPGDIAPGAMTEYLTDDWAFFVRSTRQIEKFRSPFQAVEVHDTATFGKLFRLDGHFMTSEKDEFYYHENLVHMAAVAHPQPERALIIGGGDGGSAEELLKHPSMQVGDAVRNRPGRRRHRAQVLRRRPRRRARRPASRPEDRGRLRLRSPCRRAVRPDRARPHRCRRSLRRALHRRLLSRVRCAAHARRAR